MTTNNAVNVGLSGATGSGNFVGSTSPTLMTPNLGVPSVIDISNATGTVGALTSLAFSPTTGGIVGTAAADNASSGIVGELITSNVAFGSAISLTSNIISDVTSISISAGDWDIYGNVSINSATTNITSGTSWCSLTSATLPDLSLVTYLTITGGAPLSRVYLPTPFLRVNVSSTTTVYLSCRGIGFSGGGTASGSIFARRAR